MRSILLASLIFGCGSNSTGDHQAYATFQDCYMDHHEMEMFPTPMAIEICCIDHPIAGNAMNVVCGATVDACKTYVTANLTDAADTMLAADIMSGCSSYITDRSM